MKALALPGRAFIALSGPDRVSFLQGLVTQDVEKGDRLLYSALLSPQGKYLYDFFIWVLDGSILLETDAPRRDELLQLLTRYKLRKNVTLEAYDAPVYQIFPAGDYAPDNALYDPRLAALGYRSLNKPDVPDATIDEWTAHRLQYDVPDCPNDLRVGLSSPFEGNIDLLNGIAFDKGCYMGQELVSRIHHRGLVKRRFPNLKD